MSRQLQTQAKTEQKPSADAPTGLLQRAKGPECEEEERPTKRQMLKRYSTDLSEISKIPSLSTRCFAPTGVFLEPRFGHDFSQVRVHTDGRVTEPAAPSMVSAHSGCHCPRGNGERKQSRQGILLGKTSIAASGRSGEPESKSVGPEEAANLEPLSDSLPGAPNACVVNAMTMIPYSRSGILRSSAGTVGEKFEVRVEWKSAPAMARGKTSYCAAECGEYHQFIKGHMRASPNKDGSGMSDVSSKIFGGIPLDENVFREDGLDRNPNARYGHRKEKQTMDEEYKPNRAAGTEYVGRDFPNVSIGTYADIDLTFLGKFVDVCNGTETLSDPWRVQYNGVIRP